MDFLGSDVRCAVDVTTFFDFWFEPYGVHLRYANLFPSLQLRYDFTATLVGRAIYSSTIARPGFTQSAAGVTVDAANGIVTTGKGSPDRPIQREFYGATVLAGIKINM